MANADKVFAEPTAWSDPEILFIGAEERPYDAGNVNVTVLVLESPPSRCAISHGVIYYGRNEKEAAVQGGAVLSSGEPDRASGVLLRSLRTCMRNNDIFTATYSPGALFGQENGIIARTDPDHPQSFVSEMFL